MAYPFITTLFFALALSATSQLSAAYLLRGNVSCLDCNPDYDFSGIKVLVKCDHVKKLGMGTTEVSGSFTVELPSDGNSRSTSNPPLKCHAKLFGASVQLYASKENIVSKIIKQSKDSNSYKISTPLAFSISCSSKCKAKAKAKANNNFESSKTVDLPVPPEWGLPPTSYYVPFFPIIGIP